MRLTFGDLSLEGESRGGDRTWFRVHPPGLAFDVGRGALKLVGAEDLFVTHGHLDHCLGVPFVLSNRSRHGEGTTRVLCPRAIRDRLRGLIDSASRLEEHDYSYELVGLEPGDSVEVGRSMRVEAFATDHVVPSLGYHLVRSKRELAGAYRGLSSEELVSLKRRGETIEKTTEEDWLSYCGDTRATVFDEEPRLTNSRVLVVECTFLDPTHRDRAELYGHLHLDDLAERRDRFENETIVLCHLSGRHTVAELRTAVDTRLGSLADRVEIAAS